MTLEQVGTLMAIGVPVILGWRWLFRLEGRIETHEKECAQRQKNLDERHLAMTATLSRMDESSITCWGPDDLHANQDQG